MDNDILLDPITMEIMSDPVISKLCGHSFSNDSIIAWLKKKETCPNCNIKITENDLTPNYTLRDIIEHMELLKEHQLQPQLQSQPQLQPQLQQQLQQQPDEASNSQNENKEKVEKEQQIKPYIIRELCQDDIQEAAILLEKSTREDIFMNFFFINSPGYRITGGTWFCNKMLTYALKKARVWGCFELDTYNNNQQSISGVMIAQPPHDVNGVSISEMFKVGMYMAPIKLGVSVLSRILKSSDFAERIHQAEMKNHPNKHWYLNCIAIEHSYRRSQRGSDLIKQVLHLADSQNASIYTECDLEFMDFFKIHNFTTSKFYQQHSNTHDAPHFYTMIRNSKK
ncbi:hypothetical protein ACTA71_008861 [Dictyostelium dimigraforme]